MSRIKCLAALASVATVLITAGNAGAYTKTYNANAFATAPDPTSADGGAWSQGGTTPANVTKAAGSENGRNFWAITDTGTSSLSYNATGAANDGGIGSALVTPWKVSFSLSVIGSANPTLTPPAYNVPTVVDVRTGRDIYDIAFVNDGTNEGVYAVQTGTTFTASAANKISPADFDLDLFHTYEMVYVPNVDRTLDVVNVSIDGVPVYTFTDATTNPSGVYRVFWGSGLSAATENIRWENFTFTDVVPEPTSTLALVGGFAAMGLRGCRRTI